MEIERCELALPLSMGTVNCYLIATAKGYVLIDTGPSIRRALLSQWLADHNAGPASSAAPGTSGALPLALIVITHGDFDHTGNAAYLRQRFEAPIAMHLGDRAMAERGDMFAGRNKGNRLMSWVSGLMFGFGRAERFVPDVWLDKGHSLADYGLDADTLMLPGHSSGSLGILTSDGDLFCGDLLENADHGPALGSIMDDPTAARTSLARLQALDIRMVYPGHGQPFEQSALAEL